MNYYITMTDLQFIKYWNKTSDVVTYDLNLHKYIKEMSSKPSSTDTKLKWPMKGFIPPIHLRLSCYDYFY